MVVNGGEDEPGSLKDRVVMEHYPHKVLEGVILAAFAIGANEAILYVNSTYTEAHVRLQAAIQQASELGFLGEHILGSEFSLNVRLFPATQEYVAGEDSAALEAIEGREPKLRQKPPHPTTAVLFGQANRREQRRNLCLCAFYYL